MGDVLTKPMESGGLNFGTIGSSAVLLTILVICILYTTMQQSRQRTAVVNAVPGEGE